MIKDPLKDILGEDDYGEMLAWEMEQENSDSATLDPIEWIQKNFYIPELNGPIKLYPHQEAVLREAYRKDDNGNYIYNIVVWSDIKKSAKSSIAAAVAFHRSRGSSWGSIKIVANDLKQADSRVSYYFRRALELNPRYTKGITYKESGYSVRFVDNHTIVEAIPIDPGGEAGGNDDLIIFSELWAARHKAIQRMWTEMTLSPTKFGKSQRWVETYAGYSGESPILESLYENGVKNGKHLDLSFGDNDLSDLEIYARGSMLCLWNTKPRLPWQTQEYYASESTVLTDNEFRRVHRNEFVSSSDTFVPSAWWNKCQTEIPPLNTGEILVLAVDAAVSGDCFGIVGVSRHVVWGDDSEAPESDIVKVRYSRKWIPPLNGKIIYGNPESPADRNYPEGEIRWLVDNYDVVCVAYDEYQLHDFMQRLRRIVYIKSFPQGKDRLLADKQLHDGIREVKVLHGGDRDLTEHINNADKKTEGEKMRIIKRNENMKIDLAVCLSMANSMARKLNL